jgi:pyruvate,water dikinase
MAITSSESMTDFIVQLSSAAGTDCERVGPKAANLATLARAGLPTPGGFCLSADAYRVQIAALGLDRLVHRFATAGMAEQRRLSVEIRLGLYEQAIAPAILEPLLAAWTGQREQHGGSPHEAQRNAGASSPGLRSAPSRLRPTIYPWPSAVRSSALIEDRQGANFAGQFESFLGIDQEAALLTAVRACWAALWTSNARRYMDNHALSPADTAMAVLIQPLVDARASGGGLSETADGQMLISATWGLGSAIAQGEVVPDRIVLSRQGFLRKIEAGRKHHRESCGHGAGAMPQAVPAELARAPCLDAAQAVTLGRLMRKAEAVVGGQVEIEWALDDAGFKLLQARPLTVQPVTVPDRIWLDHPGLNGHPAGIGWGAGRAVVVSCECELSRVAPGDVLVTRVAGPALSQVLPRVAGVVAELGGSTSHLASLARERGIPMVLGVLDATSRIPEGSQVAVDGVAGIVRWMS